LGCVVSFSRYLVLKLVISALTVGICRSVCKIVFGTYHAALTIDLRTLFWNRCSISMLELLAVPQTGMPYDQMGFRIVLYISNLFSSDSFDFLPMIQYMRWSCNPSCKWHWPRIIEVHGEKPDPPVLPTEATAVTMPPKPRHGPKIIEACYSR
jgi:hypothetical protein